MGTQTNQTHKPTNSKYYYSMSVGIYMSYVTCLSAMFSCLLISQTYSEKELKMIPKQTKWQDQKNSCMRSSTDLATPCLGPLAVPRSGKGSQ